MPFKVKVRVAVCFAEAAALGVDGVQGCAVGYYAFAGADADYGAVLGVEGGEEAGFVAEVGVVPDPEGGEAADWGAGDGAEGGEEGVVEDGEEGQEDCG